ncbi:Bcr/CflA family drug resistance efflux transporter [Pseudooceanicola lipolyticus]|uniref:Bcr/CflA family efflux transporter n=1 Tax=Pseudooceanicola lipolyticus TaxID=2029104 RepID=A0A2M8IY72_9RHOB|nr:multidrug effflux MFS transporter [Pseudooceanicola lipolyticus]PJE35438.1 Bcr/CflA family drug resistance efflux transporter [Pseudooceanicola lipolyticus]
MLQKTPSRYLNRITPPHISTLILATGLSALAMNIFLPSLPKMTEHFQTDYRLMQLSVALYLGASGILQILIGPISDYLGRRPVILAGVGLFLLATIGCVLSPTIEVFLVFRMCQAVVVVTMVLSRAAIRDMYDQDRAASMIGYVTMGMAVAPMIGPALGGLLDEVFGWKSSFWLIFILGAVTLWLIWADFGETARVAGKSLRQQLRDYPALLRSPRFWGYSLALGFSSGAFFAYLGGAPYVGTEVYGMTPGELGVFFSVPAVGYFGGNFITARYATRFGINLMVVWGGLIVAFGLALPVLLMLAGYGSPYVFFGCMCFVGFGNGMTMPNATAGALSVRPHLAGSAAGLSGAIMLGGGAALSAFAGSLLTPENGALTLLTIMLATTLAGLVAICVVIWRERQLGL